MKTNISKLDRFIRLILSIALLIISKINVTNDPLLDIILLVLGFYFLLSVLMNYCIIYFFLDFSSVKHKKMRRNHRKF